LDAPSPLDRGPLEVRSLYYGSGTDKNRAEYRDSVSFVTGRVDASKLVSLGSSADSRNKYWGFKPDSFPLNARVWYPDGPGPYPLILVAHGNHDMKDFSDPGYEYLGRHLASRGFILASLDMNFINGGIRGENDARGWLFLKHLEVWRDFNEDPENPFRGMVDMGNIGIIGHSRGGEAVGHAAAFNRLTHYPDDATLTWDFDFDINAVVAIAPVDGQYRPTSRLVPLEDINYLVFHGTHDGDVSSYAGLRTWKRISFSLEEPHFKASVYVHRANHGQWNTVWGAHDRGPRSGRTLDLRGLLDGEEQRQFALVYVTAFLEANLKGRKEYLPLFRDHRVIGGWLPKTMYITQFQESSFRPLASFEEDIDVTTGSSRGVEIRGDSLATWKENVLPFRYRTTQSTASTQENQAVWIGWNNRIAGEDTTRLGPPATYTLSLPDGLPRAWQLDRASTLDFMLTALDETPAPRKDPGAEEGEKGERGEGEGRKSGGWRMPNPFSFLSSGKKKEEDEVKPPLRLSVRVQDEEGNAGKVLLNRYGPVRRPIEIRISRRDDQQYLGNQEMVLQSYSIPLGDFLRASGGRVDLSRLVEVQFLFDESTSGSIILDEVGFSKMDPAFLGVSAAGEG
ncbi:MAG: alpha/beta hydrolase family protein, partial [Longimicrobiales bacterium]